MSSQRTGTRHVCRVTTSCRESFDTGGEPSDHAKKTKYSCKCDATFGRWDDLQHHVRSVCRLSSSRKKTTVYTCTKCGKNFVSRRNLTRHARTACTVVKEPPSPKRSNREDTTPHHPLVTDEDPSPTTCRRNC